MENKETDLQTLEGLAQAVEYFTLQYTTDGWYLSFVSRESGEPSEFMREDLKEIIKEASSLVFPASPPESA